MKIRAIIFVLLLICTVYGSGVAFADPPDPFKGRIQVSPRNIFLGDTITVQCTYIPQNGAKFGVSESGLYAQYGTATVMDVQVIRNREAQGPYIWKLKIQPDTVGKDQVALCGWIDADLQMHPLVTKSFNVKARR